MESTSPHGEGPTADPVADFRGAVQDVLDTADAWCGVEVLEPGLERALAVLRQHPGLRGRFEDEIVSLLDSPVEGVVELVSFVMHELRWPAVEQAIRNRLSTPGRNVSHFRLHEAMLDAFSDSWGERDLYARFRS
ncbi:hypothetical protein [Streptomyces sp. GS7]|uniref:hypothetical protein n=1 Tax=Streptomyces sp. GS7 TaxID=2692234 RepID=UPI0013180523|nr:hypothetical protein [Streptomyces sp. GS7]QHC23094.1 hypothetical protein GR130_18440 [Streptomyces sp. GS7]